MYPIISLRQILSVMSAITILKIKTVHFAFCGVFQHRMHESNKLKLNQS